MAYAGELLTHCPLAMDFGATAAVVVTGASWNPCGHMLLCVGASSDRAWYLHVAGIAGNAGGLYVPEVYGYPAFMREKEYQRYLTENGKRELRRLDAKLTNPAEAYTKLMRLMADKWFWKGLPDNCATFVREVIAAGGGDLKVMLNCPDQEFVRKVGSAISEGLTRIGEFQRLNPGPKW